MHNNNAPPLLKKAPPKATYSVVEASIAWARADGARSANDPLIARNTALILNAIKSGELKADRPDSGTEHSSVITREELKRWMMKHAPSARPAFLFDT
jgi:hypothetical protein